MSKDPFKQIGKKLNQYHSPVDFDAEWKAIVQKQGRSRKKRLTVLLFCSSIFLTAALVYAGTAYFSTMRTTVELDRHEEAASLAHGSLPSNNTLGLNTSAQFDLEDGVSKSVESVKRKVRITETGEQKVNNTSLYPAKDGGLQALEEHLKDDSNSILAKKEVSRKHGVVDQSSSVTMTSSKKPSSKSKDQSQSTQNLSDSGSSDFAIPPRGSDQISSIQGLKLQVSHQAKSISPSFQVSENHPIPGDDIRKSRRFEIYASGGLGQTIQQFKTQDATLDPLTNARTQNEKALESYIYHLGINTFIAKKSFFSFGADYIINFDQIDHQYEVAKEYDFENVLLRRVNYSNGNVEEIFGDTTLLGSQVVSLRQFNRYTSLSLNASIGHYFVNSDRWRIGANIGFSYNVYQTAKGKSFNKNELEAALIDLDEYRRSYGLGVRSGLEVDYRILKNLYITIQPTAAYSLSSAISKDAGYQSNFKRMGLSAGLKMSL